MRCRISVQCGLSILAAASTLVWTSFGPAKAQTQQEQRPNILFIMGDDIGQFNISAYNNGMMGYSTPNIDRIAKEGALFTDYSAPPAAPLSSPGSRRSAPASPRLAFLGRRRE